MSDRIKHLLKSVSNFHRPSARPNVFIFSTPRSGSTWLMELIWSQPGFKHCNEPLNLRDLSSHSASAALYSYFSAICQGRLHFKDPRPFRGYYRLITDRIVFKVIHGGEDQINWFRDTFNARIVFLIRHPIPVTLSREIFPRLDAFLNSDYRRHFTDEQLHYARRIVSSGTKLERGVLAWCLQNTVALRDAADDWALLSYEQLVLEPRPVIDYLASKLALPKPERMIKRLTTPSAVKPKSDRETQQLLEKENERRSWLVEKWRNKVDPTEERAAMEVLKRFHLEVYRFGDVLPVDRLWIKPITSAEGRPAVLRIAS
jgi:hypothetical protein